METKICSVCKIEKPIDSFHLKRDKRKGGKLHTYRDYLCLSCKKDRDKKYRYINRHKLKESRRIAEQQKPKQKKAFKQVLTHKQIKERERDRYYANREENLLRAKSYYYCHREERIAAMKEWRLKNKGYGKLLAKAKNSKASRVIVERMILGDEYIKSRIQKSTGLSYKSMPKDLIDNYRMQIKTKRLLKQRKDENTKTS